MSAKQSGDLIQPALDTRLLHCAEVCRVEVVASFRQEGIASSFGLRLPVDFFDQLLGGQRYQHADDYDPHFSGELAPAVQRLR
jgi:hypothetical protein